MADQTSEEIKTLLRYYSDTFVVAYADLVALTADKPVQVLVEIENFNSHLVSALQGNHGDDVVSSNLKKALDHLKRGTLDCYKLLFAELDSRIREFVKGLSVTDIEFGLGTAYFDTLSKWRNFSEEIRQARRSEMSNTGAPSLDKSIDQYKKAVEGGFGLYEVLAKSQPKIAEVRRRLFWYSVKSHWPFHLAEVLVGAFLAYLAHSYFAS